jgi:hypothetical protein
MGRADAEVMSMDNRNERRSATTGKASAHNGLRSKLPIIQFIGN